MADYVELRARSAFSFLEGASLPEDLAARAAELGYKAIALGDRDAVYGQPRFHQAAVAADIKPIVGADVTLEDESRLYLLVPDRERYKNLCRLLTDSKLRIVRNHSDTSPKYPAKGESRIKFKDLENHGNGLICLAGGSRSPLARGLTRGEDVRPLADRLKCFFGPHNLFLDLQRHSDADEERLNRKLVAIAETCRIPITATNDVCYAGTDRRMADILTCIGLGTTLEEAGRRLWVNGHRCLKVPSEMQEVWRDLPRAVAATRRIAERCEFTLKDLGYRFPDYPLPPGETPDGYLHTHLSWRAGTMEQ
jgi:error-prone DNA polymerase